MAACELELFDAVQAKECTADVLASTKGWDGDATGRLLNALASLQLLETSKNTAGQGNYMVSI